jgi:aspartyl-tRNA(Asn)/glutamyl-tRNA(Gln) amidotransferase subunit B
VYVIPGGAAYLEAAAAAGGSPKASTNWIVGEMRRRLKDTGAEDMASVPVAPAALAELTGLTEKDVISSTVAKEVFEKMWATGRRAPEIVEAEGLAQVGDTEALGAAIAAVLAANPDAVTQYQAGKTNAFGFLVGQAMKAMKGKANPKVINDLLRQSLDRSSNS